VVDVPLIFTQTSTSTVSAPFTQTWIRPCHRQWQWKPTQFENSSFSK